jgi:hypothetical protein
MLRANGPRQTTGFQSLHPHARSPACMRLCVHRRMRYQPRGFLAPSQRQQEEHMCVCACDKSVPSIPIALFIGGVTEGWDVRMCKLCVSYETPPCG